VGGHCAVVIFKNRVAKSRSNHDFLSDILISETNHREFDCSGRGPKLLEAQVVFSDSVPKVSISCAESEFILWIMLPRSPSDGAICTAATKKDIYFVNQFTPINFIYPDV
jgi:hypothetical protein